MNLPDSCKLVQIGKAFLILGDAEDAIQHVGNYEAVLTDPPFGIAYKSGYRTDTLWSETHIRGDKSVSLRDGILNQCRSVPMLVFGSWKAPRPKDTRAVLIWDKGPALGMGALDIPWKPSTEEIYVLNKGFVGSRDCGAVIYNPPVQSMAKNGHVHPNQKPVGLLKKLLSKMPNGTIFDPFMGSGSTGVAALETGRSFVGIESDVRYFEIAVRRCEDVQKQMAMFGEAACAAPNNDNARADERAG